MPEPKAPAPVVLWKNLGVLRGIAIGLVVLSHSMRPQGDFIFGAGALDREPYFALFHLVLVNVPIFVFVSGYFMARFSATWPAARAGARLVLGRYALWTFAHFAILWLARGRLDLAETAWSVISGSGRPHWFLILLVQLYLLTPLLAPWARSHPRAALGAAVVLQIGACAVYYLRRAGVESGLHIEFLPMQLPFYLLGVLTSARAEEVTRALERWQRLLAPAMLAGVLLLWAETRTLRALQPQWTIFFETPSLMLAALLITLWSMGQPSESSWLRNALNWVGLRSFGVLLAHDYVVRATTVGLWHFERVLGLTSRPRTEAPLWIFGHFWSVLPHVVLGLGVPLLIIEGVERLAGKRARTMVFG